MTRAAFIALVERAILDGRLSTDEALALVAAWDAGEIDAGALPLVLTEASPALTEADEGAAWAALLALLGSPSRLSDAELREAAAALQQRYTARARRAAEALAGGGSVEAWQREMIAALAELHLQEAQLGAGRRLTGPELAALQDEWQREALALARFAETNALRRTRGDEPSAAEVAARAALYAGAALGLYYAMREAVMAARGAGRGMIVEYIAMDDNRTCPACLEAARRGPYLLGEGPRPGEVCYGGAACRCRREERYDPVAYARLMGRAA